MRRAVLSVLVASVGLQKFSEAYVRTRNLLFRPANCVRAERLVIPAVTAAGVQDHGTTSHCELGKVLFSSQQLLPENFNGNSSVTVDGILLPVEEETYQARISHWKAEYASLQAYRDRYGKCKNVIWGDWGLSETRLRYLALIQEALLQLTIQGTRDEDLGYLAARAKSAIKMYVRERSMFPWRLVAEGLDGSRQWAITGEWDSTGKNYQQLRLEKMAAVIDEEGSINHLTDRDLERKVSLKIFNSAAKTNEKVDSWSLQDLWANVTERTSNSLDAIIRRSADEDDLHLNVTRSCRILENEDDEAAYRDRIEQWRHEYADVEAYRRRLGKCKNKGWGCWSLLETRLRYLGLIQEALLRLTMAGARDEDLGYLAVEARSAIKQYVRERSQFPWRMVAVGLDGTRQWMKTGEWTPTGKTYDQLRLEKTVAVIAEEGSIEHLTDCDLERKVSLKIFRSAAKTNHMVDSWSLQEEWRAMWMKIARIFRPAYKTVVCSPAYLELVKALLIDEDMEHPSPLQESLRKRFPACTKKIKVYAIKKGARHES